MDATLRDEILLTWRIHLLRRAPRLFPVLLLTLMIAAGCAWLLFASLLPMMAALLLLIGATAEYLFPITYQITTQGVRADSLTARLVLNWNQTRRCIPERNGLLLSPLPAASRLNAFRGVFLRFAPDGEPGDRTSVLAAVAAYLPTANDLS